MNDKSCFNKLNFGLNEIDGRPFFPEMELALISLALMKDLFGMHSSLLIAKSTFLRASEWPEKGKPLTKGVLFIYVFHMTKETKDIQ